MKPKRREFRTDASTVLLFILLSLGGKALQLN